MTTLPNQHDLPSRSPAVLAGLLAQVIERPRKLEVAWSMFSRQSPRHTSFDDFVAAAMVLYATGQAEFDAETSTLRRNP